jgi:hypothetical protein
MTSWGSLLYNEGSGGNVTSWDAPVLDDEGSGINMTSWDSLPLDPDEDSRENMTSWESLPLDEGSGENVTAWDSLLFDEGSRENVMSLSQIGSNTVLQNGWLTGGANGLQMEDTESFEVEDVPYSLSAKETLRMVLNTMIPLLISYHRCTADHA